MSKNIIFEYGAGSDFVFSTYDLFIPLEEDLKGSMVKTVGTVTINTRSLYRPKIKVEFSSNIHFIALGEGASIQLEFIITRKSQGFDEIVLGSRQYEITNNKGNFSQSFNFIYYDQGLREGAYIYSIKTMPILAESCKVVMTNCNINVFAYSDFEYLIDTNNEEEFYHIIEGLLNEEIRTMILNVQEDSREVVKEIKEIKKLIDQQNGAIFTAISLLKEIKSLIKDNDSS